MEMEKYIMFRSVFLQKKILLTSLILLFVVCFGFLFGLNVERASAYYTLDSDIHNEFYYAESAVAVSPAGFAYNSDFSPNINNSSAVLAKTYYIEINARTYEQLDSDYNHLVVCWGRKTEMDILSAGCVSDSEEDDPSFHIAYDAVSGLYDILDGSPDSGYYGYNWQLYARIPSVANFPYVGYRVRQSDVINDSGNGGSIWVPVTVTWAENELFDIGIMLTFQYSSVLSTNTYINAYYTDSTIVSTVENIVKHASSYSTDIVGAFEKTLGIYRAENTTVNYTYLKMLDGHFNKYGEVTSSVSLSSVYIPDENYVWQQVLNCDYVNGNGIVGFNATFTSYAGFKMSNGILERKQTFGSKIIRQATGHTYSYSNGQIPATVFCNVTYSDYNYSDFYIRISNSGNPSNVEGYFPNNLLVDVYPTSVETRNNRFYLYFDYNTIRSLFGNTMNWTVLTDYFNISYNRSDIKEHIYVNEETITVGHKRLVVSFDDGYENNLFGLEITGNAPITAPVELACTVEYSTLDNNLDISTMTFSAGIYWDNQLGELEAELLSINGAYANYIYGSISPAFLDGVEYIRPVAVYSVVDYENLTATFEMVYMYPSSVLVVSNNINSEKWAFNLPDSIAEYSLEFLGIQSKIPNGYRVSGFSCSRFRITERDYGNEINTKFVKSDSNKTEPYSIMLTLTDKWPVTINYLEQWKTSPFAIMKEFNGNIRVSDYDDIFSLTGEQVSSILSQDVVVLQFISVAVRIDQINVTYNQRNDKYTVDLTYTRLSHKVIDKNGNSSEILIGLTPFSEWSNYFGQDWSILYLSSEWFEYENQVAKNKLYGFFGVSVFQEQVTDFYSWFSGRTSDGCITVFSQNKVAGSGFYRFLRGSAPMFVAAGTVGGIFLGGHPVIGSVAGAFLWYTLTNLSEVINNDNGTYYSYFFYLDGTTNKSYQSRNKADSYDDDSSSFVNTAEDLVGQISDILAPVSTFGKIILGLVALVIVVFLGIKAFDLIFGRRRKR